MPETVVTRFLLKWMLVPILLLWACHLAQRRFSATVGAKRMATLLATLLLLAAWVAIYVFVRLGLPDIWLLAIAAAIVAWASGSGGSSSRTGRAARRAGGRSASTHPLPRRQSVRGVLPRGPRRRGQNPMRPRKLSMPFWCVGNPVGDPFGPAVMDPLSSLEVCDILCRARSEHLIDFTAAHDDDLVAWDPKRLEDDLDPASPASATLRALKEKLDAADLPVIMVTCGLHGDPVFRNGGLAKPESRDASPRRAQGDAHDPHRQLLGARYLTYWVARDGFETQFAVPWERTYGHLVQGLNLAERYAHEQAGSVQHGTIEPKPNEPRGEMFLPTTGHALASSPSSPTPASGA